MSYPVPVTGLVSLPVILRQHCIIHQSFFYAIVKALAGKLSYTRTGLDYFSERKVLLLCN